MISIEDLWYRYSGASSDALNGLTLDFPEGSLSAIMGSNGSGKSTLARCLNGLLQPASGSVIVEGWDTRVAESLPEIRRRVGLVFQEPLRQMTSATVERELAFGLENLGTGYQEMRRRVAEQAEAFDLADLRDFPPTSLSAGDQQRLALASVLILNPTYLILDESTSLLSVQSRKSVLDTVLAEHRRRKMAVVLITQYPQEAMLAARLVVLAGGRAVIDGLPADVFRERAADLQSLGVSIPLRYRLAMP